MNTDTWFFFCRIWKAKLVINKTADPEICSGSNRKICKSFVCIYANQLVTLISVTGMHISAVKSLIVWPESRHLIFFLSLPVIIHNKRPICSLMIRKISYFFNTSLWYHRAGTHTSEALKCWINFSQENCLFRNKWDRLQVWKHPKRQHWEKQLHIEVSLLEYCLLHCLHL